MNNCGCNNIRGPLLTENKVKSLLSENLQYHLDKDIPLFESVFRIGSNAHLKLIKEARKMYSRNIIDLCEEDEHLIKTYLGEFALYKGEAVPLDLPMLEENQESPKFKIGDFVQPKSRDKYIGQIEDVYINKPENLEMKDGEYLYSVAKLNYRGKMAMSFDFKESDLELISDPTDYIRSLKPYRGLNEKLTIAGKEVEKIDKKGNDPENWVVKYKDGSEEPYLKTLNEAKKKKKKKDPPLGKPKRGGPKAYYVYVRDPKTKRIKKVTFGSGGLRAKIRNKKARNAFAKRHDCKNKKDRTKASYWSCNLPRYASMLGLGANMSTFW